MRLEFAVKGHPPKKHGEKSMWSRKDEAPFVAVLREKALEARTKSGFNDCFQSNITLELAMFVPQSQIESIGDLDNFITGVCDSLQSAYPSVFPYMHSIFQEPSRKKIDPRYPILFEDDAKIMTITAKKIAIDNDQEMYYKVAIETVDQY